MSSRLLSEEERSEILEREIMDAVHSGWRVVSQTSHSAQLVKNKGASCLITIILLCLLIVPGILYMLLYKGEEGVYIEVTQEGKVNRTFRS